MAEGAKCEGDRAVAQFDVARLAHDIVGVGDNEVGKSAVVFFEPFRALGIRLARHFGTEISKLLAKLFDLCLGLKVLECAADGRVSEADGDGTKGACVELGVSLHDVEGALGREGVVVSVDTINNLALFRLGVWGDGEAWACGSVSVFGGWCERGSGVGRFGVGRVGRGRG